MDAFQEVAADVRETKDRVGRLEQRFDGLEGRFDGLDDRVGRLEVHAVRTQADIAQIQQTLLRHDARSTCWSPRFPR